MEAMRAELRTFPAGCVSAGREAKVERVWVYAGVFCDDTHAIRQYKNFTDFLGFIPIFHVDLPWGRETVRLGIY
jgi:hypothetical protein